MSWLIIVIIILVVLLIALAYYWVPLKKKAIIYISKKVMDNVKVETNPAELQLSEDKTYGILKYTYLNKEYTIRVPYEKKMLRKIGVSVHHINKDGIETDISNQPGIPVFITANNLGSGKIVVRKGDEILDEFTGDQIVKY